MGTKWKKVCEALFVVRIPGGWIYTPTAENDNESAVFVPLSAIQNDPVGQKIEDENGDLIVFLGAE